MCRFFRSFTLVLFFFFLMLKKKKQNVERTTAQIVVGLLPFLPPRCFYVRDNETGAVSRLISKSKIEGRYSISL